MLYLLTQLAFSLRSTDAAVPASPAAALLESAGHHAGADPHYARELREAASAWLRVVR